MHAKQNNEYDRKLKQVETGPTSHENYIEKGSCNDIYHFVFDHAPDAIMILDFDGNFVDVNFSFLAMFGYTNEELLKRNVIHIIDPENLKANPIQYEQLASGKNIFIERKMVHKDGSLLTVEVNGRKISDNYILVVVRDISKLKQVNGILKRSETHLHTILDNTDTIYVLLDPDLRVISYNQKAVAFSRNELGHSLEISEYFLDYFPESKRPKLLEHMNSVLLGRHIEYEVCYPQPDNLKRWYYVRMFPLSKGDKNVSGLMMAVSDITDHKVLELKLEEERIKKQMEITDAVITAEENERHEIGLELHDNVNQVLASARLFAAMAKQSKDPANEAVLEEVERLIDHAISEIRKLSHSMIVPFLEEFGLVRSLDYLVKTISRASRLEIKTKIKIDEKLIENKLKLTIYRIVQEQLSNILKHAHAKTVKVKLIQENGNILLSIKDDGVGFEATKKSSGIGLANINKRASLFNGKVDIITSPENGCELTVCFNS